MIIRICITVRIMVIRTKTKSDDSISKNPAGRAAALSGATHVASIVG